MPQPSVKELDRKTVALLWLHRQGLATPRGTVPLSKRSFRDHLDRTGALQLDTIHVVDRAHYLTLWSRFGTYDRKKVDRWCYRDREAYEYWGHEASILPISHLPLGRRRMRRFPPESYTRAAWWKVYNVSDASKRRVLRRLRNDGPLESVDFEEQASDAGRKKLGGAMTLDKEDKRALQILWHAGRVAITNRRRSRRVYDLAERVYPEGPTASVRDYHDSWLIAGLEGCGVAGESHLVNYFTGPRLSSPERKRVIARNLKSKRIVEIRVAGMRGAWYALPDQLAAVERLEPARGTHLICPFDSMLWQRKRAEDLLDFTYRIEIYVPQAKRRYGYYVLPILHDGRFVGRLDPKFHRDQGLLEVKALHFEPGFTPDRRFRRALDDCLADLGEFLGATELKCPKS